MVAAAESFSQPGGGGVGIPGFAMIGALALAVTVANGNNTGVTGFTFFVEDVPPGSTVPTGTVQTGSTPTWTFTPDKAGTYVVVLTVTDGVTSVSDTRTFHVPETTGQIMPGFQETSAMDNYVLGGGHNARGWATAAENWLRTLDCPLTTLTSGPVVLSSSNAFVEFNGVAGIAVTLPAASTKPIRRFYYFKNKTNQTNTITPQPGDTIDGGASLALTGTGAYAVLATDGAHNWDIISGEANSTTGGDATGPVTSMTVVGWYNKPLHSSMSIPNNLDVPQYDTGTLKWKSVAASSITVGGLAGGTAGQVYITNGTPAGAWTSLISVELTHGRFTAGGGGTDYKVVLGPTPALESSFASIHLLANATAASTSNYTLASNGTGLNINTTGVGAAIDFYNAGATNLARISNQAGNNDALWLGHGAAFSGTNPALISDASSILILNAPTTASTLVLNFGEAVSLAQFAVGTQNGLALGANIATVGHERTPYGFAWMSRNSANTLNFNVVGVGYSSDGIRIGDSNVISVASVAGPNTLTVTSTYAQAIGSTFVTLDTPQILFRDLTTNPAITWNLNTAGATSATLGAGVTSFTFNQAATTGAAATFTIAAQSTSLAAATGGTLILNTGTGGAGGSAGTMYFQGGGTTFMSISPGSSTISIGAAQAAYVVIQPLSYSQTIAPTVYQDSSTVHWRTSAQVPALDWNIQQGAGYTGATLTESVLAWQFTHAGLTAASGDRATANMTFTTQAPYASAVTNLTAGDFIVNVPASVGSGQKYGGLRVQYGGAQVAAFGTYNSSATSGALWLGGVTPGSANYALYGDATYTILNAPTLFDIRIANTVKAEMGNVTFALGGALGNEALFFDWSTFTAPLIGAPETTANFKLYVQPRTSNALPGTLTIQGAYAWNNAGATGANRTPGSIVFDIGAPTNGGTTEATISFSRNGVTFATAYANTGGVGGAFKTSSGGGYYLTNGGGYDDWGGSAAVSMFDSNNYRLWMISAGILHTTNTTFQFETSSNTRISQAASTTNTANGNLTIQAQYAWNNVSNTFNTPGSIILDVGAPTNGGATEAGIQFTRNGVFQGQIGNYGSVAPQHGALWLGTGITPSTTNRVINSDGVTYTTFNAVTYLAYALSATVTSVMSSTQFGYGTNGGATPGAGAIVLDWTGLTTPKIQSGTAATSLTVGTSLANATLTLQADAATTLATASASGWALGVTTGTNQLVGALRTTVRTVSTGTFTFDTTTKDHTVKFITATAIAATLPTATTGRDIDLIFDATGTAGANMVVTLTRLSTELINGVGANFVITIPANAIQGWKLRSADGTNWYCYPG